MVRPWGLNQRRQTLASRSWRPERRAHMRDHAYDVLSINLTVSCIFLTTSIMAVRLTMKYRKTVYFLCLYLKSLTVRNYLSRCVYNDGRENINIV